MNIILWIILGGVAGWLASIVMKTNSNQNTLGDIILGIIGALIGGLLLGLFGFAGVSGFNIYSLFVAVLGSIVLIGLRRMLT